MHGYDFILGKNWMYRYNPYIDHRSHELSFNFNRRAIEISATWKRHSSPTSLNTFLKDMRKQFLLSLSFYEKKSQENNSPPAIPSKCSTSAENFLMKPMFATAH